MPLTNFAFLDLGAPELLLILGIILLLFGSKKLPELSKSIGGSIRELKKGIADTAELKDEVKTQVTKTKQAFNNTDKAQSQTKIVNS